jgi:hypothetical protein
MSFSLQYGAPVETSGDLLAGATFEPYGSDHLWFVRARHSTELLLGTGENCAGTAFAHSRSTNVKDLDIIEY